MSELFTQKVHVRNIKPEKTHFELKASPDDLVLIQERLKLESLTQFDLHIDVYMHEDFPIIVIEGTIDVHYTQACGVTLKPLVYKEPVPLLMYFTRERAFYEKVLNENIPLEDDAIELLETTTIDLVECAVQGFSLSMDPYPRAEEGEET